MPVEVTGFGPGLSQRAAELEAIARDAMALGFAFAAVVLLFIVATFVLTVRR
jgi:hypothetical protein